ncbi:MAG: hypothetical protein Kow0013_23370 [Pararhodobacter sp.]
MGRPLVGSQRLCEGGEFGAQCHGATIAKLSYCCRIGLVGLIRRMDAILDEIDKALKRKGLSPAAASKLAAGHFSLIKNMKASKAGGKRYSVETLEKLADVLDLELYFGPRRDTVVPAPEPFEIDGRDVAAIPRVASEASAGPGAVNGEAAVIGAMAFRLDWLRERGIKPDKALLVTVTGDSMTPSIHPGDLVLLDQGRKEIVNGKPFIFVATDGETRLKRLHRLGPKTLALISDNPDHPPRSATASTPSASGSSARSSGAATTGGKRATGGRKTRACSDSADRPRQA